LRATKGGAEFHAVPQVMVVAAAAAFGCKFWKIKIRENGRFVLSGAVKPTTGGAQLEKQLSRGCGAEQPGVKLLAHLCTDMSPESIVSLLLFRRWALWLFGHAWFAAQQRERARFLFLEG
jgi:hypothetical protein